MTKDYGYTSVFSWRYGSPAMRRIWSEQYRHELWRKIWVALARAQHQAGLVSSQELADLKSHQEDLDLKRIGTIESQTHHDVMAAIYEYAEQAKVGGGKIHLGATSMDVVDNAETIRLSEALRLVGRQVAEVLKVFREKMTATADLACIGYTHLQPAEPTTVGYRLAFSAQDLLTAYRLIGTVQSLLEAKGLKGAVGTAASYEALLAGSSQNPADLEKRVMAELGLKPALISSQVSSRSTDYLVLAVLNMVASAMAKFASDVRILQSANFGEWSEPFGTSQVGSSAMPFKKNPINSEKICSLARFVNQLPSVALENATVSYLERTLDDSANRRVILPEAFLAVDEILRVGQNVLTGLVLHKKRIAHNLVQYGPFAATEAILLAAVRAGADRQKMHETLREISLAAWQKVQAGNENPMPKLLLADQRITKYVPVKTVRDLLDVTRYVGTAPQRTKALATEIRNALKKS